MSDFLCKCDAPQHAGYVRCVNCPGMIKIPAHPEDAPGGPWTLEPGKTKSSVRLVCKGDHYRNVKINFLTPREAQACVDALNRLKGETDG